ncbi:CapA family protein [Sphingobacterium sp. PU5-4]|uniref:CapA family protein n=1 Tax=Sphingobacterium tenebrionis TaxID=3111775 RepID=A0ABU8I6E7_9SPHI
MPKQHKLLFAGDVVMNSKPEFSAALQQLLASAAVLSCNFEAPVAGYGKAIAKTGPHVCQNTESVNWLYKEGFNLFSLANNHINDYGKEALKKTISLFKKDDVVGVGDEREALEPVVRELEGVKFAFMAFGENGYGALNGDRSFGHAWVNADGIDEKLRRCKEKVDVLIVQVHAGVELLDVPIPEWKTRYQELIEAGADVVVGHHPHVLQGIETYKGKLICYSLGNFYFDYPSNHPQWNTGGLLELQFEGKNLSGFQMHVVEKKGAQLDLLSEAASKELLGDLQEKLEGNDYLELVDRFAVQEWDKHHLGYYAKPFNGLMSYSPKGILKHLKRSVFNRKVDYNMIWHNLFIESNKWLVERAIRKKMSDK